MFKRLLAAIAVASLALAAQPPQAAAQSAFSPKQRAEIVDILRDALKRDPSIMRDAIAALQEDDTRSQDTALRAAITQLNPQLLRAEGDPIAGNPNGRITLVEFYDVRCPYCRRMIPTLATLAKNNPDLRIVYKDLPVLGPASVLGARALLAAQKQGGYQRLHDALMSGAPDITEDSLKQTANRLGLNWPKLQADMTAPDVLARIEANLLLAKKLEIQGTPAYIIGTKMLPGAVELTDLQSAVTTAGG